MAIQYEIERNKRNNQKVKEKKQELIYIYIYIYIYIKLIVLIKNLQNVKFEKNVEFIHFISKMIMENYTEKNIFKVNKNVNHCVVWIAFIKQKKET